MGATQKQRALLLINASSRRGGEALEDARRLLAELGFDVAIYPDAKPSDYSALIKEKKAETDIVVVGGGDGSVNCAITGLRETGLPLGILPLGTANNLARTLSIPMDLPAACETLKNGTAKTIDVGCVNGDYFLVVAGIGLSTQINRRVPSDLKRRWGVLAYAYYAYKVARRVRPFHAEIVVDDMRLKVRTLQITVCNGRYYGAGMTIADDAAIDDGRLDLCSTEVEKWWHGLRYLPALMRGRYPAKAGVRWMSGRHIEIMTRRSHHMDVDGEIGARTPAKFSVLPGAVRVIAPTDGIAGGTGGTSPG